jgi:hypothetical protein
LIKGLDYSEYVNFTPTEEKASESTLDRLQLPALTKSQDCTDGVPLLHAFLIATVVKISRGGEIAWLIQTLAAARCARPP